MRFSPLRSLPALPALLAACLIFAAPAFGAASAGGVTITRVFAGWREAASFKRISEYFTGRENSGGITVLRTHPDQRTGFYFLVRAVNPGTSTPIVLKLELITPGDHQIKHFSFPTELKSGQAVFNAGLTGDDWPDDKANPVAWKLELTSADGTVLASDSSYLWEKPAAQ